MARKYDIVLNGITRLDHISITKGDTLISGFGNPAVGLITCADGMTPDKSGLLNFAADAIAPAGGSFTSDRQPTQPSFYIGDLSMVCNVRGVVPFASNINFTDFAEITTAPDTNLVRNITLTYTPSLDKQSTLGKGVQSNAYAVFAVELKGNAKADSTLMLKMDSALYLDPRLAGQSYSSNSWAGQLAAV